MPAVQLETLHLHTLKSCLYAVAVKQLKRSKRLQMKILFFTTFRVQNYRTKQATKKINSVVRCSHTTYTTQNFVREHLPFVKFVHNVHAKMTISCVILRPPSFSLS